jgi:hypothetical protein
MCVSRNYLGALHVAQVWLSESAARVELLRVHVCEQKLVGRTSCCAGLVE